MLTNFNDLPLRPGNGRTIRDAFDPVQTRMQGVRRTTSRSAADNCAAEMLGADAGRREFAQPALMEMSSTAAGRVYSRTAFGISAAR
jgi:hypothetical protein